MKNKILISFGIIICFFITINLVSAVCVVQGYTKTISAMPEGQIIIANVSGYCMNTGEFMYDVSATNGFYYVSFGGIADSCQSRCGNVYVNASNVTISKFGYVRNYPMNSGNTGNWSTSFPHNTNITLDRSFLSGTQIQIKGKKGNILTPQSMMENFFQSGRVSEGPSGWETFWSWISKVWMSIINFIKGIF